MKNKILCLLMIIVLTAGCTRKATMKELRELQLKVEERLEEYYNVNQNYNNFAGCGIDEEEMVLIVTLVNNNKEEKEWFKKNISDSKYIKFEKGGPYTTFDSNKDVTLSVNNDTISNKGASFFLTNNSDKDYWYGPEYHLEKKDNNSWIKITTEYPLAWNTVLNTLKAHETITLEIDWSTTYGELTSGEYRLVKDNIREIDGESEKTSTYAVFSYFNVITGGTSNTIEVKKTTNQDTNKFNKYLELEGRIV